MTGKEFLEKLVEADRIIAERQAKDSEYRKKNNEAWGRIEKILNEQQGKYRTDSYGWYKAYSTCMRPISESHLNQLLKGMTELERKLLRE